MVKRFSLKWKSVRVVIYAALFVVGVLAIGVPSVYAAPCDVGWRGGKVGQLFAEPFNIFAQSTALYRNDCQRDGYHIIVGDGSPQLYIYNKAYYTKDGNTFAQNITLSGTKTKGSWIIGSAQVTLPYFQSDQSVNYFAFYSCYKDGTQWRCGCRSKGVCAAPEEGDFVWHLGGFATKVPTAQGRSSVQQGPASPVPANSTYQQSTTSVKSVQYSGGANAKEDCGARGDGATDDAQALQSCLDSNATVYIPAGKYNLGSQRLFLKESNRRVYGEGTLIGSNALGILSGKGSLRDLVVEGLTFSRITTDAAKYGPGALYLDGVRADGVIIRNNTFDSDGIKPANAILLVGTPDNPLKNVTIEGNVMRNVTRMGIELLHRPSGGMDARIERFVIRNNTMEAKPLDESIGISLSQTKGSGTIENNTIKGFGWGIELSSSRNAIVQNNTIDVTSRGLSINGRATEGDVFISKNNRIEKNTVHCPDMPLEAIGGADENIITGNDFGGSEKYGIVLQGARNNRITDNNLYGKGVKQWDRKGIASTGNVIENNQ